MSTYPDAWAALRGRPWRLLASWWPWRSLAYLASAVPVGLVALVVLFLVVTVGVLTAVAVVGLLVLAGIPLVASVVAVIERHRLRLVLPAASAASLHDRLRTGRGLPISWSEVGYAVLLAGILWIVDALFLVLVVTLPVVLLLAPLITRWETLGVLGWQVDTRAEAWLAVVPGVLSLVVAAYAVTALACAQAALARVLLDPADARLAAAVADLRRSRVDLVDAFEAERRRIERDLHDGVQQRLVALTMTLGRAELDLPEGNGLDAVREAHQQAESALEELRATVRGIHPQVLVDHGLAAAIHEIADRSPVSVDTDLRVSGRLPAGVEAAAYFVVSESLTNVARHARARSAQVHGWVTDGRLVVTIVDDGVGGADPSQGTGLRGLELRLEALDGDLLVTSPPGGPTEVRMTCPIER